MAFLCLFCLLTAIHLAPAAPIASPPASSCRRPDLNLFIKADPRPFEFPSSDLYKADATFMAISIVMLVIFLVAFLAILTSLGLACAYRLNIFLKGRDWRRRHLRSHIVYPLEGPFCISRGPNLTSFAQHTALPYSNQLV
ncbi:hypothetical protein QR680_005770 [Steinernema hermaphroditum]|uniref:Uncharacterized protein n=1 Tax=Steinernema hermaphroditum TaxID=289476 RepID=A0AA39HTC0_9BILA|nr:hypothetical protein QR680_005770 [Steinernema hermaphroditum]